MADAAITKVETYVAGLLANYAPLVGQNIIVDRSPEEPMQIEEMPAILVVVSSHIPGMSEEQNMTRHEAVFEFLAFSGPQSGMVINHENQRILAHIAGAIAQDRTMGGRCESFEESAIDTELSKDIHAASLSYEVRFYTQRDNYFQIVGDGGMIF